MKNPRAKPPLVRLAPRSNFETLLARGAQVAMIATGTFVVAVALDFGSLFFAPVSLAIVVGLMFGPLADRIERFSIPPPLSAAAIVFVFVAILFAVGTGLALPLSTWIERLPLIWSRFQAVLAEWKGVFASIAGIQDVLKNAMGSEGGVKVEVHDDSTMTSIALLAPAVVAQVIVFLASLYFFVATRDQIRRGILSLCYSRKLRWRTAHVFRDVETLVSTYLVSITLINIALGVAVALALWVAGVPSPALWGLLAGFLNYIVYVGPAVMAVTLLGVGMATTSGTGIFVAPVVYLALNLVEAQFVTPHFIGRATTLNPFFVFLSIAFWIWLWGPVGGLVAVPFLLIAYAIVRNIMPIDRPNSR